MAPMLSACPGTSYDGAVSHPSAVRRGTKANGTEDGIHNPSPPEPLSGITDGKLGAALPLLSWYYCPSSYIAAKVAAQRLGYHDVPRRCPTCPT